jgi:hypothetical protein
MTRQMSKPPRLADRAAQRQQPDTIDPEAPVDFSAHDGADDLDDDGDRFMDAGADNDLAEEIAPPSARVTASPARPSTDLILRQAADIASMARSLNLNSADELIKFHDYVVAKITAAA